MSDVSRSEYQKLVEENKKLRNDIRILISKPDSKESDEIINQWENRLKKKEEFNEALTAVAKQYFIDNPDKAIIKTKK